MGSTPLWMWFAVGISIVVAVGAVAISGKDKK